MPIKPINLIGAGGHALVVAEALWSQGCHFHETIFWDSDPGRCAAAVKGFDVREMELSSLSGQSCHVCIGNNDVRRQLAYDIERVGGEIASVAHPSASISSQANIGAGSFVAAQAVVGSYTRIGVGTIVNHGAIVDHECSVGDYCHVAPNATLGGRVVLGDAVLIGAGAVLLPSINVFTGVVIAAGAVVTKSISKVGIYKGIPARGERV